MFPRIREKEGFAYDAHSMLDAKRETGVLTTVTQLRKGVVEPPVKAAQRAGNDGQRARRGRIA